jgi:hypothetical protein
VTEDTKAWLRALHADIWEPRQYVRWNGQVHTVPEVKRKLTWEEWGQVEAILQDDRPLVEMGGTDFGFGVALEIYDDFPATYPGVKPMLVVLLSVNKNHLPGEEVVDLDTGWALFSPHTHSAENVKHLREAGRPAPQPKGFYDY